MIVLLDLNFTLVANSSRKVYPFWRQIEGEQYRTWLIDLIRPHHVILMTARPEKYQDATLASILAKTGWLPRDWHFNRYFLPPAAAKRKMLLDDVFPACGADGGLYFAIESNPTTRAMYAELGIRAAAAGEEPWTSLPV